MLEFRNGCFGKKHRVELTDRLQELLHHLVYSRGVLASKGMVEMIAPDDVQGATKRIKANIEVYLAGIRSELASKNHPSDDPFIKLVVQAYEKSINWGERNP